MKLSSILKSIIVLYREGPKKLQDICLRRMMISSAFFLVTIIMVVVNKSQGYWAAPLFLGIGFLAYALHIVYLICSDGYVYIEGTITQTELIPITKKTKAIYISVNNEKAKINLTRKSANYEIGDKIYIYLPKREEYSYDNDVCVVNSYIAMGFLGEKELQK